MNIEASVGAEAWEGKAMEGVGLEEEEEEETLEEVEEEEASRAYMGHEEMRNQEQQFCVVGEGHRLGGCGTWCKDGLHGCCS